MVHVLALTAIALSSAVSASKPAQWQGDYGKALAATRSDDRPLLIVLDVPGEPKQAVEDELLKTDGKQAELLTRYQLCHVDVSTEYGKKVAKAFKADKFPFTAIIDKTGSYVLHKKQGKLTDAEWNETLTTYKLGNRLAPVYHSTAYRGEVIIEGSYNSGSSLSYPAATSSVISPSYCPSCQKNAQRSF